MSDWLDLVIKRVREYDADRPRSKQTAVGWSEVGGCRAHLGYRLSGAWASNETDSWGASRGTAIHTLLETIFRDDVNFRTEVTIEYRGILGHADLLTIDDTSITDWKTTKLANSRMWAAKPELLWAKRVQGHGYAAGLIDKGELPETAQVRLVFIPADGGFGDWWCWEEPFDRKIADWGADRLEDVKTRMSAGETLPKDKPYAFCKDWCEFFSLCRTGDTDDADEVITDPELVAAIASYGEITSTISELDKDKKLFASLIRGVYGTAGEWRVSLSNPGEPSTALDEFAVLAEYAARGEQPPLRVKPGAAGRLSVRRVKGRAA